MAPRALGVESGSGALCGVEQAGVVGSDAYTAPLDEPGTEELLRDLRAGDVGEQGGKDGRARVHQPGARR